VLAAIVDKPGAIRVADVPDPMPGHGEVLVRVRACGICGTDLHIAAGEFPPTPYPIVPGHEFSGDVAAVGPGDGHGVAVGDRVAVDPSLFCKHCAPCRAGRGNLCQNWGAVGDTVDGAFAEYVTVPAASVYALPDKLDYRQGALIEPISCAVHGMRRLGPVIGESVLIVGAGTMGLLLQQLVLREGATRVVTADRKPERLAAAEALGAHALAASAGQLGGERFGAVVDVTGVPSAMEEAFGSVDRGGRFMIFGVAPADAVVPLSPFRIYNHEITVIGSMAVLHSFGAAVDLLAAGAIETAPLLTHSLPLAGFPQALDLVRSGEGIKVQVLPND
jgi:2-desacetyl-2-hydroxyethyl bacteriochlorophyllide A dehydrogenase